MPTKVEGREGGGRGGLVHLIMSDTNAYKAGRGGREGGSGTLDHE